VKTVTEGDNTLDIGYGADHQRIKTVLKNDGNDVKTKYFIGGTYEKENLNGTERNLYYISASNGLVAIYEKIGSNTAMHYVYKDNLGSYNVITDANGTIEENLSFDAWGRRRNATDWTFDNMPTSFLFDRGFTGHEHLDEFGLINMNGRMYDPKVGAFLSPDVFANTSSTQGLNRYSYAFNNPLAFTDPSGYLAIGGGTIYSPTSNNADLQWSYYNWMSATKYLANSLVFATTVGPSFGSLCSVSNSGMVVSNTKENGLYSYYNKDKGENGTYVQTSGRLYYVTINGKVVGVGASEVHCTWVPAGGIDPDWHEIGFHFAVPHFVNDKTQDSDPYSILYNKDYQYDDYGNKLNYGPYNFEKPDYTGISFSLDAIEGFGWGLVGTLGYIEGDGVFLNFSLRMGVGSDLGPSTDIEYAYWNGVGKPTAFTLAGPFVYENYLAYYAFQDVNPIKPTDIGSNWTGYGLNIGVGAGSTGTILTSKPIYLWHIN